MLIEYSHLVLSTRSAANVPSKNVHTMKMMLMVMMIVYDHYDDHHDIDCDVDDQSDQIGQSAPDWEHVHTTLLIDNDRNHPSRQSQPFPITIMRKNVKKSKHTGTKICFIHHSYSLRPFWNSQLKLHWNRDLTKTLMSCGFLEGTPLFLCNKYNIPPMSTITSFTLSVDQSNMRLSLAVCFLFDSFYVAMIGPAESDDEIEDEVKVDD